WNAKAPWQLMGGSSMRIRSVVVFGAAAILPVAIAIVTPGSTGVVLADAVKCDMTQYKPASGLTAVAEADALLVTWAGENNQEVRARIAIDSGVPLVRELAVRKAGGQWAPVGQNLTPEYHVVSGIRRMSVQQAEPLVGAGVELTPAVIEKNRWY